MYLYVYIFVCISGICDQDITQLYTGVRGMDVNR